MFVITFIDNHGVNTVIYSAGIGLSFSHKFHQGLINSTQWTSTTWPHMNWEHQQSCKSITKFCGQVHMLTAEELQGVFHFYFKVHSPWLVAQLHFIVK